MCCPVSPQTASGSAHSTIAPLRRLPGGVQAGLSPLSPDGSPRVEMELTSLHSAPTHLVQMLRTGTLKRTVSSNSGTILRVPPAQAGPAAAGAGAAAMSPPRRVSGMGASTSHHTPPSAPPVSVPQVPSGRRVGKSSVNNSVVSESTSGASAAYPGTPLGSGMSEYGVGRGGGRSAHRAGRGSVVTESSGHAVTVRLSEAGAAPSNARGSLSLLLPGLAATQRGRRRAGARGRGRDENGPFSDVGS